MDTEDSSEASDEDSLNNNSGGNSGSGSTGNSLNKNVYSIILYFKDITWIITSSKKDLEKFWRRWIR